MLDRTLLVAKLEQVVDSLFIDDTPAFNVARTIWQKISSDPTFIYKVRAANAPWPVPTWEGNLNSVIRVAPQCERYLVIAIDGSQIYPDRHQGLACYLINVGGVVLPYGISNKSVILYSVPHIFSGNDEEVVEHSPELINCKRQERELQEGVRLAQQTYQTQRDDPLLLLFDGSLIFWHLEAKDVALKEAFLSTYVSYLFQLYQDRILTASYISLPKSRELINLVRLYLCNFDASNRDAYQPVERLVDTAIAGSMLHDGERTIVFKNHSSISDMYPDPVRPYFFYLHVGAEVGRVEIPAWIARDELLVNQVAQIIYDQCQKGRGYPVALAEAHEQAVIKGPDRDFFYHVLTKMSMERQRRIFMSQKVIKKRGLGI